MASITFAADPELKSEMSKFSWVNWSELVREKLYEKEAKAEMLLKKLHSKEEQEFIKWSVELGRRAKKGRFKRLLSEVPPETREKLLKTLLKKLPKEGLQKSKTFEKGESLE